MIKKSLKIIIFTIISLLMLEVAPKPRLAAQTLDSDNPVLQDAISLVEVYYKIKKLSGDKVSKSDLKPYLDQLNAILDRSIAFKESFTPEKNAELLGQLNGLKKEISRFADIPPRQMKAQLPKLAALIWDLVQVLLDSK